MWWVIWLLLLVLSGLYLGARLWGLWGQTKDLGSELAIAQRRMDDVQGQLELLEQRTSSAQELSVFASPAAARKERDRAREAGRSARQRRRATSRPGWAKHVD
jgi:hypothetical protein